MFRAQIPTESTVDLLIDNVVDIHTAQAYINEWVKQKNKKILLSSIRRFLTLEANASGSRFIISNAWSMRWQVKYLERSLHTKQVY